MIPEATVLVEAGDVLGYHYPTPPPPPTMPSTVCIDMDTSAMETGTHYDTLLYKGLYDVDLPLTTELTTDDASSRGLRRVWIKAMMGENGLYNLYMIIYNAE